MSTSFSIHPTFSVSLALATLAATSACDKSDAARGDDAGEAEAVEADADHSENADAPTEGEAKLAVLKASLKSGESFDAALAKVQKQMGESPMQQGEFWNFGEYDAEGNCIHMVLVRGGDKLSQVQYQVYEPGSSGFGWCDELKISK